MVEIRLALPADLDRVRRFYAGWAYRGTVGADDVVLLAEEAGELIGVVRLCAEERRLVLRGMRVAAARQRQGIGAAMLDRLDVILAGKECFCLPYDHLLAFYGRIGFRPAEEAELPPHLRARLRAYRAENPRITAMRRPPRA